MDTNRDLNYRLFIQKESNFIRTDIHTEYERYATIRSGDVEKVRENFEKIKSNFDDGKGVLSDDPVRNTIYHLVVAGALIARFCVEAGMEQDVAYTLTDIYIRKADKCRSSAQVIDLLEEMQLDFAERMRDLRKAESQLSCQAVSERDGMYGQGIYNAGKDKHCEKYAEIFGLFLI